MSNPWKYGFVGLLSLQGILIGAFFYFYLQSHDSRSLFKSFLLTPTSQCPVFSPINSTRHRNVAVVSAINSTEHLNVAVVSAINSTQHLNVVFVSKINSTQHQNVAVVSPINSTQHLNVAVVSQINSTQQLGVTSSSKLTKLHFEVAQRNNITRDDDVSQFVSFHDSIYEGRQLGNQIFDFAAVLFAAELTGRTPVLKNTTQRLTIEKVFQLNLERVDHDLCPCYTISEAKYLTYDEITDKHIKEAENNSILIDGFRQSWKYSMTIKHRLRRHLVFTDEIQRFAEDFLKRKIPRGWKKVGFVRVGIHVRRGDIANERAIKYGFSVANGTYFENAMRFFIDRYSRVQFIAMSDDRNWIMDNIVNPENMSSTVSVNVTYSLDHSAGQDLAILSLCDHVIMSTGTYGWWGAWLAKGTTIYYEDWPRLGSELYVQFKKEDFFPPSWIPMTN